MSNNISDLKNQIKNKDYKSLYLFYGQETFLRDFYTAKMKESIIDETFECFNFLSYNTLNEDFKNFTSFLESYPQMSERKLIILRDSSFLKLAEFEDELNKILSDLPDFVTLIFIENDTKKIKTKLLNTIKKKGFVLDFKPLSKPDLYSWVSRKLMQGNKKISDTDLSYLVEICNMSLLSLDCECEKLIAASGEEKTITRKLIDNTVNISSEYKTYMLSDYLINKNADNAYKLLDDFKKDKIEAAYIIPMIYNQIATIYMFWLGEKNKDMHPADFIPENRRFLAGKYRTNAMRAGGKNLRNIMKICAKCDADVKSFKMDGYVAIEIIMASILNIK